jgi:cytochrome c-type biogenesis protein CcmE
MKKKKRLRFIISGIILASALGYLIYTGMRGTVRYYMTVSELMAKGNSASAEGVRLGGRVVEGSINWDSLKLELKFDITDGKTKIPVLYKGVVPDAFKSGAQVIVEGTYSPGGFFRATTLLAKCPSKYLAAPRGTRVKGKG